jgi:hypothetical protein
MQETEESRLLLKSVVTAVKNGDVAVELLQGEGGIEINSVGTDGVGVGFSYPEEIGISLFAFVQNQKSERGGLMVGVGGKNRTFPIEDFTYQDKPALRINLRGDGKS